MGNGESRPISDDELEYAVASVLPSKIRGQKYFVALYFLGLTSSTSLLVATAKGHAPLESLKSTEGVGFTLVLMFATCFWLIRALGRLDELRENQKRLLEYKEQGNRISEDHAAWRHFERLSSPDKLELKVG